MLRSDLGEGAVLDGLRQIYRAARLPFVVIPEAIDPSVSERLRAEVEPTLVPFSSIDRGRYLLSEAPIDAELGEELRQLAAALVGAPLELAGVRWLRFGHGDYSLMRDDQATRQTGRRLELTCDLSAGAAATEEGQIVYTDGKETIVLPQWPGAVALVDKPPSLYRYERYLTHTVGDRQIYRLRLLLQYRQES
jgi:hypothetical protein